MEGLAERVGGWMDMWMVLMDGCRAVNRCMDMLTGGLMDGHANRWVDGGACRFG